MSTDDEGGLASADAFISALESIRRTDISDEDLAACTTEDDFTGHAISLLVEVGSYCCVAAGVLGSSSSWSRDKAAIGGNMVRLYKLITAMLDQTTQRRGETSFIFARLAFETIIAVRFLMKHHTPELIDSYVKNSFKHEVRLRETILSNIDTRGKALPIEDRMMKSIDHSFANAGLEPSDLDDYKERNWGGKNIYEKASDLGLEHLYLGIFAGPSQSVHGAWFDLYSHHLKTVGELEFRPNIEWKHPRPQPLFAIAELTIPVLDEYFGFMLGSDVQNVIKDITTDLSARISEVDAAHEAYLAARTWPEI